MAKVEVGQVWNTDLYGKVEVIEKVRPCIFIGRFLDTGFITKPSQARAFYSGKITDFSQKNSLLESYGHWIVIREVSPLLQPSGTTKRRVECKCICGETRLVTLDSLTRGSSANCGCVSREVNPSFHGDSGTRLYECWRNMKARCRDRGDSCNYTDEWKEYLNFKRWALCAGYTEEKILLRGTADSPDTGDYEPDNCRWGSKRENYEDWVLAREISSTQD